MTSDAPVSSGLALIGPQSLVKALIGRSCHSWYCCCCIIYNLHTISNKLKQFLNLDISQFDAHPPLSGRCKICICMVVTPCNVHTVTLCPVSPGANGTFVSLCVYAMVSATLISPKWSFIYWCFQYQWALILNFLLICSLSITLDLFRASSSLCVSPRSLGERAPGSPGPLLQAPPEK